MFKANIQVTLRPSILDPQGKAVRHALHSLGFASIDRVRVGKQVELWIDAADESHARTIAATACEKLLANPVMEDYTVAVEAVEETIAG